MYLTSIETVSDNSSGNSSYLSHRETKNYEIPLSFSLSQRRGGGGRETEGEGEREGGGKRGRERGKGGRAIAGGREGREGRVQERDRQTKTERLTGQTNTRSYMPYTCTHTHMYTHARYICIQSSSYFQRYCAISCSICSTRPATTPNASSTSSKSTKVGHCRQRGSRDSSVVRAPDS